MTDYRIHSVTFDDGAVSIIFGTGSDVRVDGKVALGRQVQFSLEHPDYAEDMELIERQIVKALRNILDDWESSEPYVLSTRDDDEDDEFGSRHQ